jgi:hypothetical protein
MSERQPVIFRWHISKKTNGTLGTASLPADIWLQDFWKYRCFQRFRCYPALRKTTIRFVFVPLKLLSTPQQFAVLVNF